MRAITEMPRRIFQFSEKLLFRSRSFLESRKRGVRRIVRGRNHDDFAAGNRGGLVSSHHERRNKYPSTPADRDAYWPHVVGAGKKRQLNRLKGRAAGFEWVAI